MFALSSAANTRLDARLKLFVSHGNPPLRKVLRGCLGRLPKRVLGLQTRCHCCNLHASSPGHEKTGACRKGQAPVQGRRSELSVKPLSQKA
jgi:hypothetical protein